MKQKVYLKNGKLFADEFVRVVHGQRGDYVEFTKEQILIDLLPKFDNGLTPNELKDKGHYYHWLYPKHNDEVKVYFQLKTVKYANYKVERYYVSITSFLDFKDPEKLNL